MSKRKAGAASPAVDDYETQADRELDEELDETLSIGDDDDDDLWDSDEAVAIADEYSAFVVATLPAKMKVRPLAAQSNEWLLATIGRAVDEINDARDADRGDDEDIIDLELDLVKLNGAVVTRGLIGSLSDGALAVIQSIILRPSDKVGDEEASRPASSATNLQVTYIPRHLIRPDPAQPRAHADDELKESIRASGILQPITVRPLVDARGEYIIVDGERRWQGAEDVLEVIPCIVRDDQEDEYTRLKTQLVANTGKALSPIEEAHAFARMLEANNVGVAALARDIGRPPSSVNDRLKLLELGPWLEWIDNGSVSISMAVEHLVPLRGLADELHQRAIDKMIGAGTKDGSSAKPGTVLFSDVEDFGIQVGSWYDEYMYPLVKSKSSWEKQPLFNTKSHDADCGCGGVTWAGNSQNARKCCGNPDWWKPLHAAAKKKEREAAKESGESAPATKGQLRIVLPDGAKTLSVGYGNVPKDVVELTNHDGRWRIAKHHGDTENAFDPADLKIDESKLVRLKQSYGVDVVGLRDVAAVDKARAAFVARFAPARERVGKKLLADFEKVGESYAVKGTGVHVLLEKLDVSNLELAEAADVLEIDVPEAVRKVSYRRDKTKALGDWFAKSIKRADAERLLSFVTFLLASEKRELPTAAIEKDVSAAIEEIQKKRAPWATSKASKPAAKKKAGAK